MATLPARFCMALVSLCLALLFAQPSSAERSKARRMSTPPTVHSNTWKQVKSRPTIVALHPYPAIRKAYKLLFGIEDESKVLALLLRSNTMAVEMQWIPLTEIEPNSAAVAAALGNRFGFGQAGFLTLQQIASQRIDGWDVGVALALVTRGEELFKRQFLKGYVSLFDIDGPISGPQKPATPASLNADDNESVTPYAPSTPQGDCSPFANQANVFGMCNATSATTDAESGTTQPGAAGVLAMAFGQLAKSGGIAPIDYIEDQLPADADLGEAPHSSFFCPIKMGGNAKAGGKADDGKADAGKADAGKADAGKADAGKADAGKADAGKADAGKADAGKADAGKADAGKADAGKADISDMGGSFDTGSNLPPQSYSSGTRLLGHELGHITQQTGGTSYTPDPTADGFEASPCDRVTNQIAQTIAIHCALSSPGSGSSTTTTTMPDSTQESGMKSKACNAYILADFGPDATPNCCTIEGVDWFFYDKRIEFTDPIRFDQLMQGPQMMIQQPEQMKIKKDTREKVRGTFQNRREER